MELLHKYNIDLKSLFKRGIKAKYEPFGVFLVTGYMGSGKSYFCVKYAFELDSKYKVKTNIHSLKLPNKEVTYFESLNEIYNDTEDFTLYVIDELGKKYTKEAKADKDFYNFLQMSRKTKRIVLIIHQEYMQVPMWLRGVASEVFTTRKVRFLPLFITYRGFPVLNNETYEWEVEYNYLYLYKRVKYIANLYNTFETVATL